MPTQASTEVKENQSPNPNDLLALVKSASGSAEDEAQALELSRQLERSSRDLAEAESRLTQIISQLVGDGTAQQEAISGEASVRASLRTVVRLAEESQQPAAQGITGVVTFGAQTIWTMGKNMVAANACPQFVRDIQEIISLLESMTADKSADASEFAAFRDHLVSVASQASKLEGEENLGFSERLSAELNGTQDVTPITRIFQQVTKRKPTGYAAVVSDTVTLTKTVEDLCAELRAELLGFVRGYLNQKYGKDSRNITYQVFFERIDALEKAFAELLSDSAEAQSRAKGAAETRMVAGNSRAAVNAMVTQIRDRLDDAESAAAATDQGLSDLERDVRLEITRLRAHNSKLSVEVTRLQSENRDQADTIASLTAQAQALQAKVGPVIAGLKQKVAELTLERDDASNKLATLKRVVQQSSTASSTRILAAGAASAFPSPVSTSRPNSAKSNVSESLPTTSADGQHYSA